LASSAQVAFQKLWHAILTSSVRAVGPAACLYHYGLIIGGSWIFYSLAVAIVISTVQRGVTLTPELRPGDTQAGPLSRWQRLLRLLPCVGRASDSARVGLGEGLGSEERLLRRLKVAVQSGWYRALLLLSILVSCGVLVLMRPAASSAERSAMGYAFVASNIVFAFDFLARLALHGTGYLGSWSGAMEAALLALSLADCLAVFAASRTLSSGESLMAIVRFFRLGRAYLIVGPVRVSGHTQTVDELLASLRVCLQPLLSMAGFALGIFGIFAIIGMQVNQSPPPVFPRYFDRVPPCSARQLAFARLQTQRAVKAGPPRSTSSLAAQLQGHTVCNHGCSGT
jgi:hypothetical protein